jgi:diguanylate cyclase (GGDEF)-like protein/PAS domain S-box-containing protein
MANPPDFDEILRDEAAAVLNGTPDGVVIVDRSSRIVFFSPSAEDLFGWSRSEVLGHPLEVLLPTPVAERHRRHVEEFWGLNGSPRLMGGGRRLDAQHKDGRLVPVEIAISKFGEDDSFAIAHVRDVTERVATAEALTESHHQIRALLCYSASPLVVIGSDQSVKYANPAYCAALSYTLEQVLGRPNIELIHPDDLVRIQATFATDPPRDGVLRVELRALHADGSWHWLDATIRSLLGVPPIDGIVVNFLDVTAQRESTEQLVAQRAWFGALVAHSPDAIAVCGSDLTVSFGNPAWEALLDFAGVNDLSGLVNTAVHPGDATELSRLRATIRSSPSIPVSCDVRLGSSSGWRWYRSIVTNLTDDPEIPAIVLNLRDIDDRKREAILKQALAEFSLIAPTAADNDDLVDAAVSLACAALDMEPTRLRQVTSCWPLNSSRATRFAISDARDELDAPGPRPLDAVEEGFLQSLCQMLTSSIDRLQAQAELRHQARHDGLTGLANRALLNERLDEALAQARADGALVAVLLLDLDNFKLINDSLGHGSGDQVLLETSARLISSVRAQDTIARFGGDEFVIVALVDKAEEAMSLAHRVQCSLDEPMRANDRDYFVTASIGVSLSDHDAYSPSVLLRSADVAMYTAKRQGRGCVAAFTSEMYAESSRRFDVLHRLRAAIDNCDLIVHYQPVIELRTNRIVAVEALARWTDPDLGPITPGEFIAVAEESGLIVPLGRLLVEQAVRDVSSLFHRLPGLELSLAINVSAKELTVPGFTNALRSILTTSGFDPANLVVELTETALVNDPFLALECLTDLRRHGVKIAIDDFGTGFSTLQTVRDYPIDFLKIDSSFTRGLDTKENRAIAAGIITLARALGAKVVAEGVETVSQLKALRQLRCEQAQGFYWAPALPLEQLRSRIETSPWRVAGPRIFR